MFLPAGRFPRAVFCLAACLLWAGSGCGLKLPWSGVQGGPLEPVEASDLQPGCYCEIDMVVPLTALKGSLDCYSGTVREVTHDEIVLADVLEQTRMEYATSSQRPPITRQKRDLVRVPRTGIDTIWALPPARNDAAGRPPSPPPQPTAIALPSNGASAVLPPTPNNPAGFDPPQAAGDAAR
jgi:hypothetical protein